MKKEKNIFEKLKNKLQFIYKIGMKPNYELFEKIYKEDIIKNNYTTAKKGMDDKNVIINPKAEDITKNNNVYIFTYEYLLKNGLLLELNDNFFNLGLYKFKNALKNAINEINSNRENLDKIKNDYGFELIDNLSILYAKIRDIKTFVLGEELYGEAKSLSENDLNNIIEKSISNISNNTTEIVGQYYEDSVLFYFLNHANVKDKIILPRLLFYMNFIIFKSDDKNNIYIEFIPFNQINKGKTECYNEMDFSFYTINNIDIPMSSFHYRIFSNTFNYIYKGNKLIKNDDKNNIINFPSKTLTFFEIKNNIKRTNDNKIIDNNNLISIIKTFISKLPVYMELYKSKSFIDKNCNNVKFICFYDHNNGKLEDSMDIKESIISEIEKKSFNNLNISINIQIIFGSKQIQTINYYELLLENKKTNEELKKTKERVKNLEDELNNIKKLLSNNKNEYATIENEINENDNKDITTFENKDKTIELDEKKMKVDELIENLKENFEDYKLKIFEKALADPRIVKCIKEYNIEIVRKLAKNLTKRKYECTKDEKLIEKYALKLVNLTTNK